MMGYNGVNIKSKKGVEMRMKTRNLFGKGNEVIF
jgi:hypothetical protein